MNGQTLRFETITSNYEQVNPEFMRVKINVCYAGKNRNGTNIDKTVLDDMAKTFYGVPVVGEIDFDEMKFKGHGGKIEISDEGWKEVKTTLPYGFVDPTTPVRYESILEKDGMTHNDYLTVSAYLWRGRYPELDEIFEKETVKQSMEITVEDGEWSEDYTTFDIKKARATALCLLGVEPCFESSKATIGYSLDDSKSLYQEMMDTFKQFTLEATGGETMPEEIQEVEVQEVVEVKEEVVEEIQEHEVSEEQAEVEVEEVTAKPEVEEVATEELEQEVSTDEESSEVEEVVEEAQEVDYQVKYEELQAEYNELEVQYGKLAKEVEDIKVEYNRLVEFENGVLQEQRQLQVEELFAQYPQLEEVEEFAQLKEDNAQYSLEELETKCLVILGKQVKKSYALKQPKQSKVAEKIKFESNVVQAKAKPYGGLLD